METLYVDFLDTPVGLMALVASEKGLKRVGIGESSEQLARALSRHYDRSVLIHKPEALKDASAQLVAYFRGELKRFTLPLDEIGTPFQKATWRELRAIPYGKAIAYEELARRAGKPGASRAAGSACGANPLLIVTPCHRVLRKSGELGGFGAGLPCKQYLLELEGQLAPA